MDHPRTVSTHRTEETSREPGYVERMNKMWGWLIKKNVAPV
jgi:hypothetical protein